MPTENSAGTPRTPSVLVEHVRRLAGVDANDSLQLAAIAELAPIAVAYGAAGPPAGTPLLQLIETQPFFSPVPLEPPSWPELGSPTPDGFPSFDASAASPAARSILSSGATADLGLPFELVRFDAAPFALILQRHAPGAPVPSAVRVLEGDASPLPGVHDGSAHVLNLGAGRVVLHLCYPGEQSPEWVVVGDPDAAPSSSARVAVFSLRRAALVLDATALHALVRAAECAPWLHTELESLLRSIDPLRQVAAAGLWARLWLPVAAGEREALARGEGESATQRVAAWAAGLPETTCRALAARGEAEASSLVTELAALTERAGAEPEKVAGDTLRIVRGRDDLASAAHVLRAAPCGSARLEAALAAFDREAACHLSTLGLGAPLDDERLRAVAWMEPDAWWAELTLEEPGDP